MHHVETLQGSSSTPPRVLCSTVDTNSKKRKLGKIIKLEHCQREFKRQINGELPYRKLLKELGLTTLVERRARGDLIETFKIYKGIANYRHNMFRLSRSGYNVLYPK